MNAIETNIIFGTEVCDSILSDGMDFNRPVTRKLLEAANKLQSIHAKRFVMAVPGFFTSAIIDPIRRILIIPFAVASTASTDLHERSDRIYNFLQGRQNLSVEEMKILKNLQKERTVAIVTLPITFTLATSIGIVATTALAACDIAASPIHTAWRVAKIK